MSVRDCIAKAQAAIKDTGLEKKISKSRIEHIAKRLEKLQANTLTPAEFKQKLITMIEEDDARHILKLKAMTADLMLKSRQSAASVIENSKAWGEAESKSNSITRLFRDPKDAASRAFMAEILGGGKRPGEASNLSVSMIERDLRMRLMQTFNTAIEGIESVAQKGVLDLETRKAMHAMVNGKSLEGIPNNAIRYAKAFLAVTEEIFGRKSAYNPFLDRIEDYIGKQTHLRDKIAGDFSPEAKAAWVNLAMDTFGKKSYDDLDDVAKRLKFEEAWEEIVAGRRGFVDMEKFGSEAFRINNAPGNILRRQAAHRAWIAESPEKLDAYSKKYGHSTLYELMDSMIDSAARETAIMAKYTAAPEDWFERTFNKIHKSLSGDEANRFKKNKPKFVRAFKSATGANFSQASNIGARFAEGAMKLNYIALSGGFGIRQIQDLANTALMMRSLSGRTVFGEAFSIASEFSKGFLSAGYARQTLKDLAVGLDFAHMDMFRDMGSADAQPGMLGKMARLKGKLNLSRRMFNAMTSGHATILMRSINSVGSNSWEKLPQRWQSGFKRYGIGEPEWEVIRSASEDLRGSKVTTVESVEDLPDEVFVDYMQKTGRLTEDGDTTPELINKARYDISLKYGAMIHDHLRAGASQGSDAERFFMYQDTDINSGTGMILRLALQFKCAMLATKNTMERAYFSGEGSRGDFSGVAQFAVTSMFLYSLSEYIKQIAEGKTPEDPTSAKFVAKAIANSGFTGILSDTLISEFQSDTLAASVSRGASGLLGPTISTGLQLGAAGAMGVKGIMEEGRRGEKMIEQAMGVAGGTAIRFAPNPINVFYTKAAIDYYFANGIREFLDDGFIRRMERRTSDTPGLLSEQQEYLFGRPSGESFFGE